MICQKGHEMADNALLCPACTELQGFDKGFRLMQIEFLHKAMRGDYNYTLRVAKGREHHVIMYGMTSRTFCGEELPHKPPIYHQPYDEETLRKVCVKCRSVIAQFVEEIKPCPSI